MIFPRWSYSGGGFSIVVFVEYLFVDLFQELRSSFEFNN
jgi:hypothetical protein